MDIIHNIDWCNILSCSAVLSAHPIAPILSDGMPSDKDCTVLTPPLICVPVHCTAGHDLPIPLKPQVPRALTWAI